jgi:hypothetical protein
MLPIPALLRAGNHVVDDIHLEDALGNFIVSAEPAVAAVDVIDKVIVTSVRSRPLSMDEIRDRGIIIDESNFTAYEFTFGIATESGRVPISFDVAFPQDEGLLEGGRRPVFLSSSAPPGHSEPRSKGPPVGGAADWVRQRGDPAHPGGGCPGNIAFLNQFFQVLVLVSNVAPQGSQLVVTSATATLILPTGPDLVRPSSDDPLAPARLPGQPEPGAEDPVADVLPTTPHPGPLPQGGEGGFGPGVRRAADHEHDTGGHWAA